MSSSFAPKQQNWHIYQDDAAEPTTQLSNENTLAPAVNNVSIVRVRVTINETGGKAGSGAVTMEYSTDNTNFTAFGTGNHWNYADGQAANGGTVTTNKCTDTTGKMHYHEDASGSESWVASTSYEMDFAIKPNATAFGNTTYYFRFKIAGTEVPLNTSMSHPQIATAKFFKYGGTSAAVSGTSIAKVGRKLRVAGAVAAVSSLAAAAIKIVSTWLLKTDQWIAYFPNIIFGGTMAPASSLSENVILRRQLTAAMFESTSSLLGQHGMFSRFSGVSAAVSALAGQSRLLNMFSGAAASESTLTGQSGLFNRFSGVVAAISDFSFSNLISRIILGGTVAANAVLDATLTFIGAAATVVFGGMIDAVSTLSAVVNLIGLFILKTDQWIAEFVDNYMAGGTFAAASSLAADIRRIGLVYIVGGVIAAESYIVARVSLIVQLLIDQWRATFDTLALGGEFASTSALSALTRLRQVLSAAAIAAASTLSGSILTVEQFFYYAAGLIAATSEMTAVSIQRLLITAGSVVVASALSAQTSLRRMLTEATVAATSAMSFGVIQRFYRMAGTVAAVSSMSVAVIKSLLRMAGSMAVTSAMSAQTILRQFLAAATIEVHSTISLSAVILRQMFAGIVNGVSSLVGKLQYIGGIITVLLAGMIAATSSFSLAFLIERFRMAGSLAVVSAFSGAVRLFWLFTGTIASTSTMAFGSLRRTFLISGTIRAVSSFVALAIQGATAVIVTVHRLIRPIALLMGRIRGDKRNITK